MTPFVIPFGGFPTYRGPRPKAPQVRKPCAALQSSLEPTFPCTVLQPHWPSLQSYLRTLACPWWPLHLGALSSSFAQWSSFRYLHTSSSQRPSWLPPLNRVLPYPPSTDRLLSLEHFLNLWLYIYLCHCIFNVCLQLDYKLPEGRDTSIPHGDDIQCPPDPIITISFLWWE